MVFNHLWHTPLHAVQRWLGFVTAAEAFFFISGVVVGIVHGRKAKGSGLGPTSRKILVRAFQLYLANLALVFLFASLEAVGALDNGWFLGLWDGGFRWGLLFSFDQPYYLSVLNRYVAFLALTPIALWCLVKGHSRWLLAGSLVIWGSNLFPGHGIQVPLVERGSGFPLASWQLLFFVGMLSGFHRGTLADWWRRRGALWLPGLVAAVLFFVLLNRASQLGMLEPFRPWVGLAFGRGHLGPLRLVNLAVAFALIFELTDRFWRPLAASAGRLLLPLGQSSLYVFLLHIPMVWWSEQVLRELGLAPVGGVWWFVAADFALIGLLWWMVQRKVLFGWIPR